jgi:hypothetical protein
MTVFAEQYDVSASLLVLEDLAPFVSFESESESDTYDKMVPEARRRERRNKGPRGPRPTWRQTGAGLSQSIDPFLDHHPRAARHDIDRRGMEKIGPARGGNGGARIFRSLCAAIWPGKGLLNWENSKAPRPPNSTGLLPQSTHSCGCRRWTWPPTGALRARPAICGASGRASVNSGAANQRSPDYVDPFHRKVPESREPRT